MDALKSPNSQSVLFLQGPLGPFFRELAKAFTQAGYIAHRIAFNGGDQLYGGEGITPYTGTLENWPAFLNRYLKEHRIQTVFLLGDCRYYHFAAKEVCEELGTRVLVFEEGYLRPNTITLEEHGVNAFSRLDLTPKALASVKAHKCLSPVAMGNTMQERTRFAAAYYWAAWFGRHRFSAYQHHRDFHPMVEGAKWCRGAFRKMAFRQRDAVVENQLTTSLSQRFFMVALQVHDDSQMRYHSNYASVEAFIEEVAVSFAQHAPSDTVLVFKHHPMDRGYTHYAECIDSLVKAYGLQDRVIYCHDLRLPSIYNHCRGLVTVNSTVGPSALLHKVPVKVMGRAMYDLEGLTSQCSLDAFWENPEPVDIDLFHKLQTYLFDETQINGSFFHTIGADLRQCAGFLSKTFWYCSGECGFSCYWQS